MKLLLVFAALAFTACTSSPSPSPSPTPTPVPGASPTPTPAPTVACSLEQSVASGMAQSVASTLGCSNPSAIQADIMTAAGKVNFCAEVEKPGKPKGVIANIVCPILVPNISAVAIGSIPSSWGCSGSDTTASLTATMVSLCEKYISL